MLVHLYSWSTVDSHICLRSVWELRVECASLIIINMCAGPKPTSSPRERRAGRGNQRTRGRTGGEGGGGEGAEEEGHLTEEALRRREEYGVRVQRGGGGGSGGGRDRSTTAPPVISGGSGNTLRLEVVNSPR
eukprot:COSAG05_NODE_1884_length_3893_cov_3.355825_2_plen_132_part_00